MAISNTRNDVVRELAAAYVTGGIKTTRFSITLTDVDNERLEKHSNALQISKQELISKLLLSGLSDLEEEIDKIKSSEDRTIIPPSLHVIEDDI